MYIRTPPHRGRCRAPLPPSRHHGHGRAISGWRALVRMDAKGARHGPCHTMPYEDMAHAI